MFDVLVVGHVTRDLVRVAGGAAREQAGGAALYTGAALACLGLEVAVVTKVAGGDEALLEDLCARGVRVFSRPSAETTTFEIVYASERQDERVLRARALAAPFDEGDLGAIEARHVHLGPLTAGDMSPRFLGAAAERGASVSLDVQGLVREVAGADVRPRERPPGNEALGIIDVLKADAAEARLMTGEREVERAVRALGLLGPGEVVVTMGSRGSLVLSGERVEHIAAVTPREAVDATGCGDSYAAGYLFERLNTDDAVQAGRFAAALATLVLERSGPFQGSEAEVRALL